MIVYIGDSLLCGTRSYLNEICVGFFKGGRHVHDFTTLVIQRLYCNEFRRILFMHCCCFQKVFSAEGVGWEILKTEQDGLHKESLFCH